MYHEYGETQENQYSPQFEQSQKYFQEIPESELAYELMHVQSEEELDQFLGDLLKSAWSGAKAFYHSPLGQKLKNQAIEGLKNMGRKALPGLGRTVGGHFFGPQGARIGGQLGRMAAKGLGLEFQGATALERRTEGSRRFVRTARNAARRIAAQIQTGQPVTARIIRQIILQEGRHWFPGLPVQSIDGMGGGTMPSSAQNSGRWYRQGSQIILEGI
jgi:hypothetical protein